jgi:SAM-dependent methyltransferase
MSDVWTEDEKMTDPIVTAPQGPRNTAEAADPNPPDPDVYEYPKPLRIDIGCGKNKRQGFIGVDTRKFEGVDVELDAGLGHWPWYDSTVDEVHCSHMVEHLKPGGRIHFVNQLYRVLKPAGFATIVVPHWASSRAYGDMTHEWPPVSEFWFYYLKREWREVNAPHNDAYTCDFDVTWGYGLLPELQTRNVEYQQMAVQYYKEAAQDIIATFKPRK